MVKTGLKAMGLLLAAAIALPTGLAHAAPADPAAAQIDALDGSLMEVMKDAKALGVKGRQRKLAPVVERVFDMATMTRLSVGPAWTTFTAPQQAALTDAFTRLTVASYAHNFDGYSGERFVIDPNVLNRGPDKVVQTTMSRAHDAPVGFTYRMRLAGGAWKVIDVYYGNISQLTTRRSDFAAPIAKGGAAGLLAHLNALIDKQLR